MWKCRVGLALVIILTAAMAWAQAPPTTPPSDVGVLEPAGRRIVTYGSPAKSVPRRLDGDTIFEISSISKVFTALFLTDAARQEVALTDPVAKYLPASVTSR